MSYVVVTKHAGGARVYMKAYDITTGVVETTCGEPLVFHSARVAYAVAAVAPAIINCDGWTAELNWTGTPEDTKVLNAVRAAMGTIEPKKLKRYRRKLETTYRMGEGRRRFREEIARLAGVVYDDAQMVTIIGFIDGEEK